MAAYKPRIILLILLVLFLMTSLACRLTTRMTQDQTNGSVGETAVTPAATTPPIFNEYSETAVVGDEFENLLDGLLHENDLADDLEDFPNFTTTP
jgi:hypothetical protein